MPRIQTFVRRHEGDGFSRIARDTENEHDGAAASSCRQLDFEDAWKMFGEGVHTGVGELFEKKLAPFLTQTSLTFWRSRQWYFQQGLYYQGGMVRPWAPHPSNALVYT